MKSVLSVVVLSLFTLPAATGSRVQSPQDLIEKAEADFAQNKIAESVAAYDRLAALVPSIAPVLWQRGVGLYELGRFKECAAQFSAHATVEPVDMENAAWHFFCVARGETPAIARASILRAGPDRRMMRGEIYEMIAGTLTPAEVVDAAGSYKPAQFYAHMYAGLYFEALGDRVKALEHVTLAADPQYDGLAGFMNVVAHVHATRAKTTTGRGASPRPDAASWHRWSW